jgi:hypothetical protein
MADKKAVVAIIHGAWHSPIYYRKLIQPLRQHGHIVIAPPMPSTGIDDSCTDKTYIDDVKRIHESLIPYMDQGKEAVIVCHSQGGIAGSAVTEGQTVKERKARGLKGGIKAIIYVCAFALSAKGESLVSLIGGNLPPFYEEKVSHRPLFPQQATCHSLLAAGTLYGGERESRHGFLQHVA